MKYKITIFDYLLSVILLCISILPFFSIKTFLQYQNNNYIVEIYQNNSLVYTNLVSVPAIVKLKNATAEIKNNKVRIKESSCNHKICIHTGWIDKPYQQIICIPNKVYIRILSKETKDKVDSVSY